MEKDGWDFMSQNRSHAVMSQRVEPLDSPDDFPTPPWAVRALLKHVIAADITDTCLEPACNRGFMTRGLTDFFLEVHSADLIDYGDNLVRDFLKEESPKVDWIITNPPFVLGQAFALRAQEQARKGVCLFTRTQFLETKRRHEELFSVHPPAIVAQFVERVPIVKGRCDPKASTATAYCWIIWWTGSTCVEPTEFVWIEPCRKMLERAGDYEVPSCES